MLKEGTLVHNRYQILGFAGGGGQRTVYRALDLKGESSSREVAVKQMHRDKSYSSALASAKLLKQEIDILMALRHPSLPKTFDVFLSGANYFLVQEFVHGPTLREKIASKTLTESEGLNYIYQVIEAVEFLHNQHPPILVRDLKPSNIIIRHGRAYLVDLGGASAESSEALAVGTRGYTPPEGIRSSKTSYSSDIYALGVILHQVLTGFEVNATTATLPAAASLRPDLDPELQRIIARATNVSRSLRYKTVWKLRQDLEDYVRRKKAGKPTRPLLLANGLRRVLNVPLLVLYAAMLLLNLWDAATFNATVGSAIHPGVLVPLTLWAVACHTVWQGWLNGTVSMNRLLRLCNERLGPTSFINYVMLLNVLVYGFLVSRLIHPPQA